VQGTFIFALHFGTLAQKSAVKIVSAHYK